MNLFELTRMLIDIPSVSGEEAEVGRFLASHLEGMGFRVETQEVAPGRANVIATTAARARVVLSTHMDTVPPFIASSEDATHIHGRGSCDAKGIIAAQVAAAARLRDEGFEELGLLFTVDEELGSLGARAANGHPLAEACEYLINGEPTENRLAVGSKGSLRLRLLTEGRAAHSAYPEQGSSAIEKMLDVLADLRSHAWPRDEFFGETTCNIGTLKEILEKIVAGRARVEYMSAAEPVRMLSVEGFEREVVRFTTDIPYLSDWGRPL